MDGMSTHVVVFERFFATHGHVPSCRIVTMCSSVRVQACWLPPGGLPTSAVSASSHLYLKRLIELSFSVPRWAPWTPMKRVPPRPRQFRQLPTHAWSRPRNCGHGLHTFPPSSVLFWAQHFLSLVLLVCASTSIESRDAIVFRRCFAHHAAQT